MKNLIFIEGVSGVGKSTMAKNLCDKLNAAGFSAECYLEFDMNPIDFYCTAYFKQNEYADLLVKYKEVATDDIKLHTIIADDIRLIRYYNKKTPLFTEPLLTELREHEFCYNPVNLVPLSEYTRVYRTVWKNFVQTANSQADYIIFDGSLLHHPINDMKRNYNATQEQFTSHIKTLLDAVNTTTNCIFYLKTDNIPRQLQKARTDRGETPLTDDQIRFWEERKDVDLRVLMNELPVETYILDISNGEWDSALNTIYLRITKDSPMIAHYDALIDEINDPVRDSEPLREYMDKWDGEAFIEALQLTPDKSVLEIGIGTGRIAIKVCGKCESFTGIDISPKTVKRAKENLNNFDNANLICGDFINHHFNESFDIIYSSLTFMHIKGKQTAIQKVADLLKSGGRFVLSISKDQQNVIDYGYRKIEVHPDSPEEIVSLLTEAELNIEKQFETEFAVIFAAVKGA